MTADVSGRYPGDSEVRDFVAALLQRFDGVAQNDYSEALWPLDDILSGQLKLGHPFFDHKGWYKSGQADA